MASTGIWWIRRDLRLHDNQALHAILATCDKVVPLFILDRRLIDATRGSRKRLAFLYAGLGELDKSLRDRGSYLVIREGHPGEVLAALVAETGAGMTCAEADVTPPPTFASSTPSARGKSATPAVASCAPGCRFYDMFPMRLSIRPGGCLPGNKKRPASRSEKSTLPQS